MNASEKLRIFVQSHMGHAPLGDEENIFQSGYVTSLFALQLVLFIEKEFDLRLGSEDLTMVNFKSVSALAAMVAVKTAGAAQTAEVR